LTLLVASQGSVARPSAFLADDERLPPPRAFRGAGSCAAASCHGGPGPQATRGAEYSTWIEHDPHARAYAVLHGETSQRIAANLRLSAAHRSALCLKCHVDPGWEAASPASQAYAADGVSCEACHGPASTYLAEHHTPAWRGRPKTALGMVNTKDLSTRAKLCTTCHIGGEGADVNHDLLAAGHPPMHFELSAYHANWKKHWDAGAEKRLHPDLDARLWVFGQAASLDAALGLLAARTREGPPPRPWPELAEYNCSGCHHRLTEKPSALFRAWPEWNGGHATLARGLLRDWGATRDFEPRFDALAELMNRSMQPDRATIAGAARRAREALAPALASPDTKRLTESELRRLLVQLSDEQDLTSWEAIIQRYAGMKAVAVSIADVAPHAPMQHSHEALDQLRSMLKERAFGQAISADERATLRRWFGIIHSEAAAR
jgi:hypothetical protein